MRAAAAKTRLAVVAVHFNLGENMSRFLIYIDVEDLSIIDDLLAPGVDDYSINEYFTLTEDGAPIVFEHGMVSDPEFCNGLALRCAGITEE